MDDMTTTRGDLGHLAAAYAAARRQIDHPDAGTIEERAARALTFAASPDILAYFARRYPSVTDVDRALTQRSRALEAFAYPGDLLDLAALGALLVMQHAGAESRRQAERGGRR